MFHSSNTQQRLRFTGVDSQTALVINDTSSTNHGRIVAVKFDPTHDQPDDKYMWLEHMERAQNEHLVRIPFREGGSLLYDEVKAYAHGGASPMITREITATGPWVKFEYGRKITNFDTGEVSREAATDPLKLNAIRDRRRLIVGGILHEWHGTKFHQLDWANRITSTSTDYRVAAWVQLLQNWMYAAACIHNRTQGTSAVVADDRRLRDVVNWRFEDFYENIQVGDLVAERLGDSQATGIMGRNFFYLERESNSSAIRLRYTTSIRKLPQFCELWVQHLLGRAITHMHGRDLDASTATSNW